MKTHFATVPIEVALQKEPHNGAERLKPLVLIVDDEPIVAETLAAILNGCGLAAITAPNGFAALEFAMLAPPEMLITDVAMPGMNGLDLAVEVKRNVPDCEIILFTGQASTGEMVSKVLAAGHDFVTLVKPVHPADLLAKVFERLGSRGCTVPNLPTARGVTPDVFGITGLLHEQVPLSGNVTFRQRMRHSDSVS